MTREARYRDDMREGLELVIVLDEQGDAYVSVLPEGHKIGPTVRLCASGGAGNVAPGLLEAVRHAFRAIKREVLSPVAEFDPKPRDPGHERARLAVELCDAFSAWLATLDCGDNSCRYAPRPRTGMRTNGGCRCLDSGSHDAARTLRAAEKAWRAAKEGA